MERIDVESGMVVGEEQVFIDGSGQVSHVGQEGYIPGNRYLEDCEYGDEDLGPNAPGYIP